MFDFDKENKFNFSKSLEQDYKDLDFSLKVNPSYGDIIPLRGADAIKRSIRNLVTMSKFDRVFQPQMTSAIPDLLFEPNDMFTRELIIAEITRILQQHEPRISDVEIDVKQEINSLEITVYYTIVNVNKQDKVAVIIKKLR